jgi:hypothetical protein
MIAPVRADHSQPGILAPPPAVARSVAFRIVPDSDLRRAVAMLRDGFQLDWGVAGGGEPLVRALGSQASACASSRLAGG